MFVGNNIKPSTSRVLPSRNCKPKNFHDESQDDTEEDESELEGMNTVSLANPPIEIPRYV